MNAETDYYRTLFKDNIHKIATWERDGSFFLNQVDNLAGKMFPGIRKNNEDQILSLAHAEMPVFVYIMPATTTYDTYDFTKFLPYMKNEPALAAMWAITSNMLKGSLAEEAEQVPGGIDIAPFGYAHGFGEEHLVLIEGNTAYLEDIITYPVCFFYNKHVKGTVKLIEFFYDYPDLSARVKVRVDGHESAKKPQSLTHPYSPLIAPDSNTLLEFTGFLDREGGLQNELKKYLDNPVEWMDSRLPVFTDFLDYKKLRKDLADYLKGL